MARVAINTGAAANDGTGDTLRAAGGVINDNFLEVYTYLGAGSTTTLSAPVWSTTSVGINTLRNVGIGTTNPRFALEVGAVGASGTTLFVNGDARITGILTIGTSSITLNGSTNIINVGTGVTINGSTGIISATSIVVGGTTLTGAAVTRIEAGSGISVDQNTGQVTITATGSGGSSQFVTTAAGIHTLSNVGIGTTNPTSKLTVTGDGTFTGVVTATTFIGALTGTATTATLATNAQGLTGTPNITVGTISATSLNASGVTTSGTLNVGTGGTTITTTSAGLVGIGTTNPLGRLQVGAAGTSVFVVTSTGSVGIGTTNPTSALTVKGNTSLETLNVTGVSTFGEINIYPALGGSADISIDTNGVMSFGDWATGGANMIVMGGSNDLAIFHRPTVGSIIADYSGEGNLQLISNTLEIISANDEYMAKFTQDGAVELYYNNSKKFETLGTGVTITGTTFTNQLNVSGVSTVGVVTGATYFGDASRIVSGRWTLGANGSNDYTFTGIGFTETTNDPTLYLARGAVYEFVNNMGAHPFQIQSSSGSGGTVYNTGITSNTVSNGTLRFEVPFNAPNTLYYQCTAHAAMGGTIIIYPSV